MTGILSPAGPVGVPGEGPPQTPLIEDQQVGDLDPRREHKPFRVSMRTAAAEFVRTGAGATFPAALRRAGRRRHAAAAAVAGAWPLPRAQPIEGAPGWSMTRVGSGESAGWWCG
jgi:hypothetical protein